MRTGNPLDLYREDPKPALVVKEGVEGYYRYHLAEQSKYLSLCGKRVMNTSVPVRAWGTRTHLGEKWCDRCKQLENQR